jgi:hypothetical protein
MLSDLYKVTFEPKVTDDCRVIQNPVMRCRLCESAGPEHVEGCAVGALSEHDVEGIHAVRRTLDAWEQRAVFRTTH